MQSHPVRVLLIDDDEDDYIIVGDLLSKLSSIEFILKWVPDYQAAMDAILSNEFDVCLLDYRLRERNGLELMQEAASRGAKTPIVFLSGQGGYDLDLEAMNKGAADCLTKDELSATLLERSIRHAMDRQRKREELIKAKRVIQALSECNHAVIHIKDELELLHAVCRIVVDVGGYRMAWVGYTEEDRDQTVTPVAEYGYDQDYLETVKVTWKDVERGTGPTGTCIRTGIPSIIRSVGTQAEFSPWKVEASKRGYASVIGLPLLVDGRRLGALTIYSSETDAFDTEEVEFLVKLSSNLSYGIGVLRLRKAQMQAEELLKEANFDLERRVEERTAELVKVNAELRRETEERRQAEDALRLSERRLRRAEVVARSGNWEFFLGCDKVHASDGAKIIYGVEGSEWSISKIQSIALPKHRGMLDKALKGLIEEGKPYNVEFKILRPSDGKIIDIHSIAEYSAEKEAVFGVIQDITERKQAEEALKDSETRLRAITDSARDAILMMDPEGMINYWNPAAERILGYTTEETCGQNLHRLLAPPRYHAQHHAAFPKFVETGRGEAAGKTLELMARRKDGEEIPVELSLSAVFMNGWQAVGLLRDITERKRAEEKLRENQSRLDLALRSAQMGVWHWDLIEDKRFFDDEVCHLLGIDPAKFNGTAEGFFSAVHPDDREVLKAALARTIGQDVPYETEYRAIWPDGSVHYIIARAKLFRDETGQPVRVNGLAWDITERKQAEDALKESQQRLSDIIDFLPDATFVIDKEGKVIAWNRAMQEMMGIGATAMLGKGDYEYALPLYGERIPILIDLVLDPEKEREAKYLTLEKKEGVLAAHAYMPDLRGRQAYLFGTASALYDSRGNVVGAIESMRDITERKLMEETVAKAEEKYRNIFENSVTGIYQTNLDGDFLNVNAALARFAGYDSPEKMLNEAKNVRQLYVHPERRYEMLRLIEEHGSVREFEAEFFRKDKSVLWVNLSIRSVLDSTGGIAYLEGTASDITDRKLLRARLAHAQKLEAIGTLAGGIAHDFNNILQPMMGYTEMVLNKLLPSNPLRHDLEQVLNASLRAKELVGQILTISRSTQEQQRIPIDISSIIKEALKLLRCSLPTSIKIRQNIQMGFALADPTQIHQVLMNLCTNAAHAMDNKGIMEVRLAPVDLSESDLVDQSIVDLKPGPYLKLYVSDTGCGMGAKTMERIFDPYFTTKEVGKGSGLGLAVVNGIVKRHNGAIAVQSALGKGSIFRIYIPRIETTLEIPVETPHEAPTGVESILFLDDEQTVAEMGTAILEPLGYKVTAETDSLLALEVFRAGPDDFDLIITDYTMPNLTGMDLVKEVRRIQPDMPVLLCTGFSEKITPDSVRELGIELLMKPYGMRQLSEAVRKILDARKGG
ncbi:MAG: PAS domain S-box protein [Syntrophobacteraceae bacterium]